jgi:L-threonylcarbamoyladenylate synthase
VSREQLEHILGRGIRVHFKSAETRSDSPEAGLAPGMLDRHYSPATPVVLRTGPFNPQELADPTPRIVRVCFNKPALPVDSANLHWLTERGDTERAARRLFALMRELDSGGFDKIIFEPAPNTGLGPAINDRLTRASAGSSPG